MVVAFEACHLSRSYGISCVKYRFAKNSIRCRYPAITLLSSVERAGECTSKDIVQGLNPHDYLYGMHRIIALMLGRLRMSVDDALRKYAELS